MHHPPRDADVGELAISNAGNRLAYVLRDGLHIVDLDADRDEHLAMPTQLTDQLAFTPNGMLLAMRQATAATEGRASREQDRPTASCEMPSRRARV